MAVAYEHRIPVVPRGGGSGLAGGAIASAGEVALDLGSLNQIHEISVHDRFARVQAGVINADLNAAAMEHGLWFAPDPASRPWSTIGGNIATNAGGLLCAKYGVTRESVLELSVVLSDGRLVKMGHRSVKGVSGLDLCQLLIGSEGTLGVIVEATVKLLPIDPHPVWTVRANFPNAQQASRACLAVTSEGHTPAMLELIDETAYPLIAHYMGAPAPQNNECLVVCQTNGAASEIDATTIEGLFCLHGGTVTRVPAGEEAEELLALRRAMHPAMESHGTVLIEDVAVPRSKMAAMFAEIRKIEAHYGFPIPCVAHAADGNLHPNFLFAGEEVPDDVWEAAGELFRAALSLGGTLTGEHGVGLLKKKWLAEELGSDQWELQREVKKVFDPRGILNPGKVF
jgi:glycolate oxidase